MKTLKASLLASVIGIAAWMLGMTRTIWPAHPQWAGFFLTFAATVVFALHLARVRRIAGLIARKVP